MDKLWITIIVLIALNAWTIYLLYKKPTTHNEIDNLKQKNKRNRASNIDNDITTSIESKEPKKGLFKNRRKLKLFTKKEK